MKKKNLNPLLLLLAAVIWGAAFVAQKEGMEYIGPFTFSGLRFSIGAVALLAALPLLDRARSRGGGGPPRGGGGGRRRGSGGV